MLKGNCILWQGVLTADGYGIKFYQTKRKRKYIRVHRLIYEKVFGKISNGHIIHHLCGNPSCVNIDHLEAMSRIDHRNKHRDAAPQLRRNVCKYGHQLVGDNLAFWTGGYPTCRICHNARLRAYHRKKRKEAVDALTNADATATIKTSTRINREIHPR